VLKNSIVFITFTPHPTPFYTPTSYNSIMPTDILLIALAFILGLIVAYLVFRARVGVYEERARNDLERWKLEHTDAIRKDSVNRSRSTLKGKISEQMAPYLPEFPFAPADARFIGNPIDFVVFDGYTKAKDEKGDAISVVLVEVKKGKGKLSREESLIKKAVEEGRVSWLTIVLGDEETE
jgi:predicted Holliday junction resolvase-like endonuclease